MVAAVNARDQEGGFATALCETVAGMTAAPEHRAILGRAVADTLAAAAAGFGQPVAQRALAALRGNAAACWSGAGCDSLESAILVNAIAAHALDFDDVHLASSIHPGVVLLPAVLTPGLSSPDPDLVACALAAGLTTAQAVAARLGQGHYHRGWHGTGTIGAFAAAAAAGRMAGLSADQMRAAFAMAGAMSGGLQANFGTDAKPAQAGFAAVAGYRAARLAAAGLSGAADPFDGPGAYVTLYGAADGTGRSAAPDPAAWRRAPEGLAVKLYACCYAAHRMVALARSARADLRADLLSDDVSLHMVAPAGSLAVLRHNRPETAAEARFSGPYTVAAMLVDGRCGPEHFAAPPSARPDILAVAARLTITEDPAQQSGGDIRFGTVTLDVRRGDTLLGRYARQAIPGTPEDPPETAALKQKIDSCLAAFSATAGHSFPVLAAVGTNPAVACWLPESVSAPPAPALENAETPALPEAP